jgi:sulfur-carrier protein
MFQVSDSNLIKWQPHIQLSHFNSFTGCVISFQSNFKLICSIAFGNIITVNMKILFFASIAELAGQSEITLQGIRNTDELKQQLFQNYPRISGMSFSVAVNKSIVQGNVPLNDTDEVALLPPFSGG